MFPLSGVSTHTHTHTFTQTQTQKQNQVIKSESNSKEHVERTKVFMTVPRRYLKQVREGFGLTETEQLQRIMVTFGPQVTPPPI